MREFKSNIYLKISMFSTIIAAMITTLTFIIKVFYWNMNNKFNLRGIVGCLVGVILFEIASIMYLKNDISAINLVVFIIDSLTFIIVLVCLVLHLKNKRKWKVL